MAHHIYHTETLVIEGRNVGEANKLYLLFTRELGMIDASAQAVREEKSKLRFSLRDFSLSTCALVRGKNGWKITGAVQEHNLFDSLKTDKKKMLVVAHVFSLLKRLVTGEEKNESLFELINRSLLFLRNTDLSDEELKNTECVIVLSVLHELGYVSRETDFDKYVGEVAWSKALIADAASLRSKMLRQINASLRESQM